MNMQYSYHNYVQMKNINSWKEDELGVLTCHQKCQLVRRHCFMFILFFYSIHDLEQMNLVLMHTGSWHVPHHMHILHMVGNNKKKKVVKHCFFLFFSVSHCQCNLLFLPTGSHKAPGINSPGLLFLFVRYFLFLRAAAISRPDKLLRQEHKFLKHKLKCWLVVFLLL